GCEEEGSQEDHQEGRQEEGSQEGCQAPRQEGRQEGDQEGGQEEGGGYQEAGPQGHQEEGQEGHQEELGPGASAGADSAHLTKKTRLAVHPGSFSALPRRRGSFFGAGTRPARP